MDGTWKGGKKRRAKASPIAPPNWTWQKELSHETRRRKGEEGGRRVERNLGGEGEGEPGPPGSAAPSTEMQQRAVDGIVSTRRLSTVLEASKATST